MTLPAADASETTVGMYGWPRADQDSREFTTMEHVSFSLAVSLVTLLFVALLMLATGLRGIVTRRPFVISGRWFLFPLLLCFLPMLATSLEPVLFHSGPSLPYSSSLWINPLMFGCVLAMLWRQMQGYMALGVTDQAFRESLCAALREMDLPFEERLSAMHLPSVGADLQVSLQSWMGSGQIRIKGNKDRRLLREIVGIMNAYFHTVPTQTNLTYFVFSAVVSVLLILSTISLLLR